MQILGLSGMYFDSVVVFVTSHSLLFRLALAILCYVTKYLLGITDFFIMTTLCLVFAVTFQIFAISYMF